MYRRISRVIRENDEVRETGPGEKKNFNHSILDHRIVDLIRTDRIFKKKITKYKSRNSTSCAFEKFFSFISIYHYKFKCLVTNHKYLVYVMHLYYSFILHKYSFDSTPISYFMFSTSTRRN